MKTALITGITGQDGSYLAELLLAKGYEVHGIVRRSSQFNTGRIDHIFDQLHLHHGDLCDPGSIARVAMEILPDEIYNLGAQSHVRVSFDQPHYTANIDGLGTLSMLEVMRMVQSRKEVRFYQASSSEMFGNEGAPQNENTRFSPSSPYACAKVFSHHIACNYRESYGLHVSCGILFNHESPRRGETFVTRKIGKAAARIKAGLQEHVYLGNLEAKRDWGFAGDYVEAMWLMLQQDRPSDYVIATGKAHSVREFCQAAFNCVGLDYRNFVRHDTKYERPVEVDCLQGDASKARKVLGWEPRVRFGELVEMMVRAEVDAVRKPVVLEANWR